MKKILTLLFYFSAIITQRQLLFGQSDQSSVDMRVTFVPEPVIILGKPTVYYELHLTNLSTDTIKLKKLEVVAGSDSSVIELLDEGKISKRLTKITGKGNNLIPPGSSEVVYIECVFPAGRPGGNVFHRLDYERTYGDKQQRSVIQGASIFITNKQVLILGSPLKEGPWAAIYDPSWERGHRRVFYTVDGNARIPGRFAIDFIKLNARGEYANGDEDLIKNWLGYNADVLAVSDGVVASMRDDFNESATLEGHPSYTADKATGNYISINIGNGQVAFYEHLRPGSIRVKPGQTVKKGDVIASLGFTGQTTGPHLHFHVADKNSPLGAESVPFVFQSFQMLGRYIDLEKFGKEPWISEKDNPQLKSAERPAPNAVIKFIR